MKKILFLILTILAYCVFTYNLSNSMFFHPDLARDYHEVLKISQGDLVFTGPKLTFGGLYTGPYYFYLFVPFFILTGKAIWSIYSFNALLYAITISLVSLFMLKKAGRLKSFLVYLCLLTNPLIILGAKNPSNAFSYSPLFILLISYFYLYKKALSIWAALISGFCLGVIFNFHYINVIFLPFFLWELLVEKQKRWQKIGFFALGGLISFVPLIAFEIKNNFIIITNTFIQKSYLQWMNNQNIPGNLSAEKNMLKNLAFMAQRIKEYLQFNPLLAWLGVIALFLTKKLKLKPVDTRLLLGALISFILFSLIVRFQFIQHYVFGTSLFIFLSLLLVFSQRLKPLVFTLIACLLVFYQLRVFPVNLYQSTWRPPSGFQESVNFVINKKLIKPGESFNLIQITKQQLLATLGYEYRYFFRLNNLVPNDEFNYPTADKLIVFSELPLKNLRDYKSWEAEQFGLQYLKTAKRYQNNQITIFVVEKQ